MDGLGLTQKVALRNSAVEPEFDLFDDDLRCQQAPFTTNFISMQIWYEISLVFHAMWLSMRFKDQTGSK